MNRANSWFFFTAPQNKTQSQTNERFQWLILDLSNPKRSVMPKRIIPRISNQKCRAAVRIYHRHTINLEIECRRSVADQQFHEVESLPYILRRRRDADFDGPMIWNSRESVSVKGCGFIISLESCIEMQISVFQRLIKG